MGAVCVDVLYTLYCCYMYKEGLTLNIARQPHYGKSVLAVRFLLFVFHLTKKRQHLFQRGF